MLDEFELDLEGLDEDSLETGGLVPPGKYHIEVLSVMEDHESKTPCLVFKLHVLAGTSPEAVGRLLFERVYTSDKARKRGAIFAVRLGLVRRADVRERVTVNWDGVVGRQAVVEVVEEEFTKKDGTKSKASRLAFAGIWATDDDRVAEVAKDAEALKRPRQPVPAGEDNFDDL